MLVVLLPVHASSTDQSRSTVAQAQMQLGCVPFRRKNVTPVKTATGICRLEVLTPLLG